MSTSTKDWQPPRSIAIDWIVTLGTDRAQYSLGEPIPIEVTLKNRSRQYQELRDLPIGSLTTLRIQDANGRTVARTLEPHTGWLVFSGPLYIGVGPGQSLPVNFGFGKFRGLDYWGYKIQVAGRYTIQAFLTLGDGRTTVGSNLVKFVVGGG
jgi:hypothetical protein